MQIKMQVPDAACSGVMLNAYPDSMGGTLRDAISVLQDGALKGAFGSFYILPSIFNTDLDRGFSVISYDLNEKLAGHDDLTKLKELGIALKLDFVLNHASVLSKPFRDILAHGEQSAYRDFFIDWNEFWAGCGVMTGEGYIQPDGEYLEGMYLRKPGLPLLMVSMPDGTEKPYWNTFYQNVSYPAFDPQDFVFALDIQYARAEEIALRVNEGLKAGTEPEHIELGSCAGIKCGEIIQFIKSRRRYRGQMDLNVRSPLVWEYYEETLKKLAGYGAEIIRLDAFAYTSKEVGARNFLNKPGTWELLKRIREIADKHRVRLLPEIHAEYREKVHETLAEEGYMTYDFFLPGLIIHALEKHTCEYLLKWIQDIQQKGLVTITMLGCHDGIPLLDLRGLLPDGEIDEIIEIVVGRGGYVKNVQSKKNMYYQVNATYFSALGEREDKMLLARAVQLFMPGKPQIWYLDLFGGKNDYDAVKRAGPDGHKEINRINLSLPHIEAALKSELTKTQLELLRLRNTHPAFGPGALFSANGDGRTLCLQWENNGHMARLEADFEACAYTIGT
ncbi:MAG: hypothetical protein FWB99_04910 [Treponema sp.]|nr:hypothetical protein [Treponema sp.]